MNTGSITTSAVLYFLSEQYNFIPLRWLEKAREFFVEQHLSPILFTAYGDGFLFDDCYVLADDGHDLTLFGGTIQARGKELVQALQNERIQDLGLDSPIPDTEYREEWRAMVESSLVNGVCYVGIDRCLGPGISSLLCHLYRMATGLFDVRYGIAYELPHSQDPASYASGFRSMSLSKLQYMFRHRLEWDRRKKTPDELWSDELRGSRRHLSGLFRGAYPASVLSEAHIQAADLRSCGIGKLSPLDSSNWLWELSDSEIPIAERFLADRDVLIAGKHNRDL
jgi:hypothetical protein